MDLVTEWSILLGLLFLVIALTGAYIKALPITNGIVYFLAGVVLGPFGFKLLMIDAVRDQIWLSRIAQIAICIALFSAGLKLRAGLHERIWFPAFRLSTFSVVVAVIVAAIAGVWILHLSWGMAVVLGAILAPTDPVLASDVELESASSDDRLRFTFTAEAALNDCTAAPFLALGLGLVANQQSGRFFVHWAFADLLLTTVAGLVIGGLLGTLTGIAVIHLRRRSKMSTGFDDFVVLGLIAFSFGCGEFLKANGFLAVFGAAVALRQVELQAERSKAKRGDRLDAEADLPDASLQFTERIGHLGELAIVVIVGAMITTDLFTPQLLLFGGCLMLVVRPLSVGAGLWRSASTPWERAYLSWFGVRGAASLFYLMSAEHSLGPVIEKSVLPTATLLVLATSIVVHGLTVSPLMKRHNVRNSRLQTT